MAYRIGGDTAPVARNKGELTIEPLFGEFDPVGALSYEGWKIRPVGSGFLLIDPDERVEGVCDSLEVAFLMLMEAFDMEASEGTEIGTGIRLVNYRVESTPS